MSRKEKYLIVLGIIFISFNLRAPITAVGSVVDMIVKDFHMSSGLAGFMTTLPLIAFACVSPFVSGFTKKYGYAHVMLAGLLFIFLGLLVRSYTDMLGLFLGTALVGVGIAIGNVLIPSIIKLRFSGSVGKMTSVYTASMCIFAAVGAGVSVPLAQGMHLGWKNSLAIWVAMALVTMLIWLPQLRSVKKNPAMVPSATPAVGTSSSSIWTCKTAWVVTFFMGIQSLLFYCMVAWLPTIIVAKGLSSTFASHMALVYQLIAIPAALLVSMRCDKYQNQRYLTLCICAIYFAGITLFAFSYGTLGLLVSIILLSLGMGGSISLAIAFISLRAPNAVKASELSGMAQSAGYLLAAVGPTAMGALYDVFHNWSLPMGIFIALILVLALFGWKAGSDISVRE